jgi:hypothetical protein
MAEEFARKLFRTLGEWYAIDEVLEAALWLESSEDHGHLLLGQEVGI